MRWIVFSLPATMLASLLVGCGAADSAPESGNSTAQTSPPAALTSTTAQSESPRFTSRRPAKQYAEPADVVRDFLQAVRAGNDETATSLLSTAAQEEAWKNGMAISADGFPDAKFEVSEVEVLDGNVEAHVMSVWSDVTPLGETKTFHCVWLLSRESHGWTVYGMATKFLDDMDPVILNFEDQADMVRKQEWAEAQIAQHQLNERQRQTERSAVQQASRITTESAR